MKNYFALILGALMLALSVSAQAVNIECKSSNPNPDFPNDPVGVHVFKLSYQNSKNFSAHFVSYSASGVVWKELKLLPKEIQAGVLNCDFADSGFGEVNSFYCSGGQVNNKSYVSMILNSGGYLRLEMQTIYGATVYSFEPNSCSKTY